MSVSSISNENIKYYENKENSWKRELSITEIINKTRNILPKTLQEKNKELIIKRIEKNYSYTESESNTIYLKKMLMSIH